MSKKSNTKPKVNGSNPKTKSLTKYLIFDFDGVLADSEHADLHHIVNSDIHPTVKDKESAKTFRNQSFANVPDHHTQEQLEPEHYAKYKSFGDHYIQSKVQLFHDFIEELKKMSNVKMAVVSSGCEHYLNQTLKQTDLEFAPVLGIETSPSKVKKVQIVCDQWEINPEEAFYFTDTQTDVRELQDLMTLERIIGCAWGWHGYELLRELLPSDQIMEEYFEIHQMIGNDDFKSEEKYDKNVAKKERRQQEYEQRVEYRQKVADKKQQAITDFIDQQKNGNTDANTLGAESFKLFEDDKRTLSDLTEEVESNPNLDLSYLDQSEFDDEDETQPAIEYIDFPTTIELQKDYVLLDSTGIRRPGQRTFGAESFATFRTIEEAYRADVICMVVDGSEPLAHQDQVVAGIVKEARKGVVVIVNKADLVSDEDKVKFQSQFEHKFAFLKIKQFIWVSAKTGLGMNQIWNTIDFALEERNKEISRDELRKLFNYLMKQKPPKKLRLEKRPIVYDLIYSNEKNPTFELLVKNKNTIHWSYLRFLENTIRANFGFENTEIKIKAVNVARKLVSM